MAKSPSLAGLITKHLEIDDAIRDNREHFLSDWNGSHPFVKKFLGVDLIPTNSEKPLPDRYIYFEEEGISEKICSFHSKFDDINLIHQNITAGPGSSSLLLAFALWLLQRGHKEVYYIPPLYYTFHYMLRTVGIRLRPISGKQLFEPGAKINLPGRKTVLLFCDPIWYAGRRVPLEIINLIKEWQSDTGSTIFIDGSFQYMQWNGSRREYTSTFDLDLTFRLICPTKSLAIPFFRFAYLIHPRKLHDDIAYLYESMIGGVNIFDLMFAKRALSVLSTEINNSDLTSYLRDTYLQLIQKEIISTQVIPECGYFVFAVPQVKLSDQVLMDQSYFELKNYADYARVNLLIANALFL